MPEHTRLYKAIEALSIPKNIKQRALFRVKQKEQEHPAYVVRMNNGAPSYALRCGFLWADTPEGMEFWQAIYTHLDLNEEEASIKHLKGKVYG